MKANESTITKFLQLPETQFVIPVYQRNYDWGEEQCKQLWSDILSIGDNDEVNAHFIGSIVYIGDDESKTATSNETKLLTIIDGQQRLTTITILYIAIWRKLTNESEKARIEELYLTNKFAQDEQEKLKLKSTDNNTKALQHILSNDFQRDFGSHSNIIKNFIFFFKKITSENIEIVQKGIRKLTFVDIALNRQFDDPQKIFESMNSTGLDLTQADLIRNYVLMRLDPKIQQKFFDDYWKIIEENTIRKDKNEKVTADFIRDFLTMQKKQIPSKNKVYEEFKKEYRKVGDIEEIKKMLDKLKGYSYLYGKLINPTKEPNEKIRKHIQWINEMEVNVSYPFLMQLYKDYEENRIDVNNFIDTLELTQSYVWRRFIAGLPTSVLNKVFCYLHEAYSNTSLSPLKRFQRYLLTRAGRSKFPKNEEIKHYLKNLDIYNSYPKHKKYFFERIETHNNKEYIDLNNPDISIEHIFPQNPDKKWKEELGGEEYEKMKEKLNTIGNLTITGNNSKLSNKCFADKKNIYKTSNTQLTKSLADLERFGIEELKKRTEEIYKKVIDIWKYPDIDISQLEKDELQNIMDIVEEEEVTNKKIKFVNFEGEPILEPNWKELYLKVINKILSNQPNIIESEEFKEKYKISKNKENFRYEELENGYFIYSLYSASYILRLLKEILPKFEMEDKLSLSLKK